MSMGPDKIGRETGPGDGSFLVTDQDLPRQAVFDFILTNFNIDGNLLKPEHKAALDQHIVPFVRANKVHVELTGTASKTGSAAHDKELSRERALRVRQYLMRQGLSNAQVASGDVHAAGKSLSTSKNAEDELDRAVRVRIVVPQIAPPQIVPMAPETIIEVDTRIPWAIQELSGFNVGIGVSVGAFGLSVGVQAGTVEYHFLLVNSRTRQMAQCRYFGAAVSDGLSKGGLKPGMSAGPGFSITQGSHVWDSFKTPGGGDFESFSGSASWVEAGVGTGTNISKNKLFLHKLGITVLVTTGFTVGVPGALLSTGNFFLKPPMQLDL
jgi:hypothetical protein